MAIFIGIDEAGYGPNLGPLVVGATVWRGLGARGEGLGVGSGAGDGVAVDLYERLSGVVSVEADECCMAIADSKVLYKPGSGLRLLERGVLTGLKIVGRLDEDGGWQNFWDATGADTKQQRLELPWYKDFDCALPVDATVEELLQLQEMFRQGCEAASIELCDMQARAVFPREFNELTEHYGTKGAALSHISIALLKDVLEKITPSPQPLAPVHITCDKHGGRNRYGALLQHHFPDEWIETMQESRPLSRYRWGPPENRVTVTFRTKGEAELPTALASMVAKYHRELAMRAFNDYWANQVADLRPTAGYPQDAKRFKAEIAAKQQQLCINDGQMWRNR